MTLSTADMLAMARGRVSPSEVLALAMRHMGVDPTHQSPVCIEKYTDNNTGQYVVVFQCPACLAKSNNDGLSQPCAKAQSKPEQLPPWGNWEQTNDDGGV